MNNIYNLNLEKSLLGSELLKMNYCFEILSNLSYHIKTIQSTLNKNDYYINNDVYISKKAIISDSACIIGPAIIEAGCEIRHNAYVRGSVLIDKNCIIGNACEIKNSILFEEVNIPHFNYVGDSIIGYKSHLGAGVKISNYKLDGSNIILTINSNIIDTKLNKFGAIISDYVEIGCNSVLNPGTIIGENTTIYPLCNIKGIINKNSIYKNDDIIVDKK